MWEQEEMLVASIFSFSHNIFKTLFFFFFSIVKSQDWWERVKKIARAPTFSNLALKTFVNTSNENISDTSEDPPAFGTSTSLMASQDRFMQARFLFGSKSQCTIPPSLLFCIKDINLNHWSIFTVKFSPKYTLNEE